MHSLPVKPIKKQSIPEAIIQELKSLIDSGHIPKGGKFPPERELAKILNVSRPSLRVAIGARISTQPTIEAIHQL
jgi:GntR family transcriptional repressor for pyruvate dehydrogenase complex